MPSDTPNLVIRDIEEAVSSAILFGVTAERFLNLVRETWDIELRQKRERDDETFSKRIANG